VAFIPDLLGRLHIECLFHGNLTKEVSWTYFSISFNHLKFSSVRKAIINGIKTRDLLIAVSPSH